SRRARRATCRRDSSAETYKTSPWARAKWSPACSSSVDLPTPGSPPTRTTDPGTSPPPSTRSNSPTPVGNRASSVGSTWLSRTGSGAGCPAADRRPGAWPPRGEAGAACTSRMLFQDPHEGQRPSHRGDSYPHSSHAYFTRGGLAAIVPSRRKIAENVLCHHIIPFGNVRSQARCGAFGAGGTTPVGPGGTTPVSPTVRRPSSLTV